MQIDLFGNPISETATIEELEELPSFNELLNCTLLWYDCSVCGKPFLSYAHGRWHKLAPHEYWWYDFQTKKYQII